MAEIVLGIGVPHSPQLSTPVELWHLHAERDRTNPNIDFAALSQRPPAGIEKHLSDEAWEEKFKACEAGIDEISKILTEVNPDIVVVIGDDQKELFYQDNMPAFSIFWGKEILDLPHDIEELPPSIRLAYWARHGEVPEAYPVASDLGRHMVESLIAQDFDVSQLTEQLPGRSLGHAHTFIRRRLLKDKPMIKMVPVWINTFFPPNVPTPKRCYEFGRALRNAIESWESDARVAIIASGGLSHFIVEEELDQKVINAMKNKDRETLTRIPREKFVSGTSEILNWIASAGALENLNMELIDYIPAYRTIASTGCGMGFAYWK